MQDADKNNIKTLNKAWILGGIGCIITLVGAVMSRSSTQYVTFIRRLIETLSVFASMLLFKHNLKETSKEKIEANNKKVDVLINIVLIVSGILMIFVGIIKYKMGIGHNKVVPALITSLLGVAMNVYFTVKFGRSVKQHFDAIVNTQYRLYLLKLIIDLMVTSTVVVMLIFPTWQYLGLMDAVVSIIVSIVLCSQGAIKLIKGDNGKV